jgi:hypothetical protein
MLLHPDLTVSHNGRGCLMYYYTRVFPVSQKSILDMFFIGPNTVICQYPPIDGQYSNISPNQFTGQVWIGVKLSISPIYTNHSLVEIGILDFKNREGLSNKYGYLSISTTRWPVQ